MDPVNTSALTPRGSTAAWRTLRTQAATHLTTIGTTPCAADEHHPTCPGTITPTTPWNLGHAAGNRIDGADDTHLRYEYRACSNLQGQRIATARRTTPATTHWLLGSL